MATFWNVVGWTLLLGFGFLVLRILWRLGNKR